MSLELATILARFATQYRETLPMSPDQQRVLRAVLSCRTPVLGVQRQRCDHCGFEALHYCSCRNRHCPKCQGAVRAQWVQDRVEDVLEVPYFHLVFTLPHELNGLARGNPRLLYSRLFEVAWYTLDTLARERLGGQLGMTAVLHTWGQTLSEHIHLHCLIPGGAFNDRHGRWQRARSRFLFPVNVMRRVFRGRFVSQLRQAHADLPLAATDLTALLDVLMRKDWTIYAKPVLGHPQQVLDYLGRYTYRIAIGHERLLAIRDDQVWFRYRDYRCGGQHKVMALAGTEFMRRFLTHVVPRGFMRVRHYGFLGNRVRRHRIARIKGLLPPRPARQSRASAVSPYPVRCPHCQLGWLQFLQPIRSAPLPAEADSS
jgi:predicted Zn-ribbon and HTH transcriptional regulator